ncbi:hypothetical protein FRC08_018646 [Ceratobasidium sp. 394]|nr:hypothetical protein FRC08_018646 [Ceratobasidium sp. 394]
MTGEAEELASESEAQHKHIEALSGLRNIVPLPSHGVPDSSLILSYRSASSLNLANKKASAFKIFREDKKMTLAVVKDTAVWIKENDQSATGKNLEKL